MCQVQDFPFCHALLLTHYRHPSVHGLTSRQGTCQQDDLVSDLQVGGDLGYAVETVPYDTLRFELTATTSTPAQHSVLKALDTAQYTVTVYTSDLPGGGTDCSAYIVVYGQQGDTGKQGLKAAAGAFGRGSVEGCLVQGHDVGKVLYICVGHNDDGVCCRLLHDDCCGL